MKMMTFIWGYEHSDFSHMCPYFWLSFFNLIVIIPFTLLKIPFKAVLYSVCWISEKIEASEEAAYLLLVRESIEKPETFVEKFSKECDKHYRKFLCKFNYADWAAAQDLPINYDTATAFNELWLKIERRRLDYLSNLAYKPTAVEKLKQLKPSITNKQRISKIVNFITPIMRGIVYIASFVFVCFVLYWIYLGIVYALSQHYKIRWDIILTIIGAIIVAILGTGIVILIIHLIQKFCIKPGTRYWWSDNVIDPIADALIFVIKCVVFIPKKIIAGFKLVWNFVYSTYKDECPPIDWK